VLNYERHLKETIKLIKEAVKSRNLDLKKQIIERVELYATDKEFRGFIISNPHLAQKLLDALYEYIKMRHMELEEIFETNLITIFAPPSMSKLLFIAAKNKKFFALQPPGVLGITINSIKYSISDLKRIKLHVYDEKKVSEDFIVRDEYIQLIIEKKTLRDKIASELIKEIKESKNVNLNSLLKSNGRIHGLMEGKLRLNSILYLIINEFVEVFYDKSGKISLRVRDNGEGNR
jgi:hypothetical protein